MRALSLIQPWAWLVTAGPKRIENRPRHLPSTVRPGEIVLVHASLTDPRRCGLQAEPFMAERGLEVELPTDAPLTLRRGGIVGWMEILGGCLCPGHLPGTVSSAAGHDLRWWAEQQHGYVLGRVGVLPFTPCAGALGFFSPLASVLETLRPHLPPEAS